MAEDNSIVFSNLPSRQKLRYIAVTIDPKERLDSSVKYPYQWQQLKTRILIFADKNIIASPLNGNTRFINVICSREYYETGCLALLLGSHRLQVASVTAVSRDIFKECLYYTSMCKLAPDWNKVDKYFVEGKYFLMTKGSLNAVEIDMESIEDEEIHISCDSWRLWLAEVELADFDFPKNVLENVSSKPFYKDVSHEPQWVNVLPSFKRGRAVYVTNVIPKHCPFKDYTEIRRHWKNTYGYRLPADGSSMVYIGVHFFGPHDFLYPIHCVRRGSHINFNDSSYIKTFVQVFRAKAGFVCGQAMKVKRMPKMDDDIECEEQKDFRWSEDNLLQVDSDLVGNFISKPSEIDHSTQISLSTQSQADVEVKSAPDKCLFVSPNFIDCFSKCETVDKQLTSNTQKFKRRVRVPKSVLRRPVFLPEKSASMPPDLTKITDISHLFMTEQVNKTPYKPIFTPKNPRNSALSQLIPSDVLSKSLSSGGSVVISTIKVDDNMNNLEAEVPGKSTSLSQPIRPHFLGKRPSISSVPKAQAKKSRSSTDVIESVIVVHEASEGGEENTKVVKKTPIFEEKEIRESYENGNLNKINIASLFAFLKSKDIPCKKRDKKTELLEKTMNFLALEGFNHQ